MLFTSVKCLLKRKKNHQCLKKSNLFWENLHTDSEAKFGTRTDFDFFRSVELSPPTLAVVIEEIATVIQHRSRVFNPIHSVRGHCGHQSCKGLQLSYGNFSRSASKYPILLDFITLTPWILLPTIRNLASLLFTVLFQDVLSKPPPLSCQINVLLFK